MPSEINSLWLRPDILIKNIEFLTSLSSDPFPKLTKALLNHFSHDRIWDKSVGKDRMLSSDEWLQIMSPLYGVQLIAIYETQQLVYVSLDHPGTGDLQKANVNFGAFADHNVKTFMEKQKAKVVGYQQIDPVPLSNDSSLVTLVENVKSTVSKSKVLVLKFNMCIAAFTVRMYMELGDFIPSKGFVQLPKKASATPAWTVLVDMLQENGLTTLQPLRSDTTMCDSYDPSRWQTVIHCAVGFSPIVLLQDKKLKGINRAVLLQYATHLNKRNKPKAIQDIEACIWSNIFSMAINFLSVDEALDKLFSDTSPILNKMSENEGHTDLPSNSSVVYNDPAPPYAPSQEIAGFERGGRVQDLGDPASTHGEFMTVAVQNSGGSVEDDETEYWLKNDPFWARLQKDHELVKKKLSALLKFIKHDTNLAQKTRPLGLDSLSRIATGRWLNTETISHFGTLWARQETRNTVLFLDSWFQTKFMYDKSGTILGPQLDKQAKLNTHLNRKLKTLKKTIDHVEYCYVVINEDLKHWYSFVIDFTNKTMFVCDSLPRKGRAEAMIPVVFSLVWICRSILLLMGKEMVMTEWGWLSHSNVPKQADTNSCGLGILAGAESE
ncbi:hypothetical protein BDP27DRAFT_1430484 [Rhodocollybia butyracea]|uniref:Ubiquitin-like protease family profile domain-containing protein n=1 Tax=Rhodocollybia butyracea TaxID=206335 RepID=A0A9P5P730_9AGAR|nr:hypothetical protein BDP27DRAFT_1430484 [Rhodocollybia butyracea]